MAPHPNFMDDLIARVRRITLAQLPDVVAAIEGATGGSGADPDHVAKVILSLDVEGSKLDAAERAVIAHALEIAGGNVSAAARLVGMDRKAFERRARRYLGNDAR